MSKQYLEPVIEIVDGEPLTSSINVGEVFGKPHKNVMQAIKNLDCSEEFMRLNFQPHTYTDSRGNTQPMYLMTERGCAWLGTGFTGKKAAAFKEKYINAFDAMKKQLVQPPVLTEEDMVRGYLAKIEENKRLAGENQTLLLENKQKDSQIQALAIEAVTAAHLKQSDITFPLMTVAKLLKDTMQLQMGPVQLMAVWRNNLKWIYKRNTDATNLPYERVSRFGLITVLSDDEHGGKFRPQARFTGDGILWAYQKLCQHFGRPVSIEAINYLREFIARHIQPTQDRKDMP